MRPNSCSMVRLMLADSLRRLRSLPNDLSHGLSLRPWTRNFSASASDTNSRNGIPCWAAADLARRKRASGISSVVFIYDDSPIFMGRIGVLIFGWDFGSLG